jgi:XTP/dITP diphosphohydrolase
VLSLASPEGELFQVSGRCEGRILEESRGEGGFGYDPLFQVNDLDMTFAEMESDVKNQISHRARACRLFQERFQEWEQKKEQA